MDKLKALELVATLAEKESDRTWRRFTIMLTINTALIALVAISTNNLIPFGLLIAGVLGIIMSFVWFKIIAISKYYERRWHEDMIAIIDSDNELKEFIKGRSTQDCRVTRPTKLSASNYAKALPMTTGTVWFVILLFELTNLSNEFFK